MSYQAEQTASASSVFDELRGLVQGVSSESWDSDSQGFGSESASSAQLHRLSEGTGHIVWGKIEVSAPSSGSRSVGGSSSDASYKRCRGPLSPDGSRPQGPGMLPGRLDPNRSRSNVDFLREVVPQGDPRPVSSAFGSASQPHSQPRQAASTGNFMDIIEIACSGPGAATTREGALQELWRGSPDANTRRDWGFEQQQLQHANGRPQQQFQHWYGGPSQQQQQLQQFNGVEPRTLSQNSCNEQWASDNGLRSDNEDHETDQADASLGAPYLLLDGTIDAARLPSLGSADHFKRVEDWNRTCKPCHRVFATSGCAQGYDCPYCHFSHLKRPNRRKQKRLNEMRRHFNARLSGAPNGSEEFSRSEAAFQGSQGSADPYREKTIVRL